MDRTLGRKATFAATLLALATLLTGAVSAQYYSRVTTNFTSRSALQWSIDTLVKSGQKIDEIAVGPNATWIIVSGNSVYKSAGIPQALVDKVFSYIASGRTIDAIAIAPNGSWVVAAKDWFWRSSGVPMGSALQTAVKNHQNNGGTIRDIVFTPAGGFVVIGNGTYLYGKSVPSGMWQALLDAGRAKRSRRIASIGADGRWLVVADQWYASNGVSSFLRTQLGGWQAAERGIDHAVLGVGNDYVMYSHAGAVSVSGIMNTIEYGLTAPNGNRSNIWARMQAVNAPSVSVAVIQNNQIAFERAYGVLEAGTERMARTDTPYPMASLSKFITSIGAMRLTRINMLGLGYDARAVAESYFGSLSLWKSWTESYGGVGSSLPYGMTVHRLLSHTASMNDNSTNQGWGGYVPQSVTVPTSLILLGYGYSGGSGALQVKTCWYDPSLGSPTRNLHAYSNSGYEVVRGMIEDLNGSSFETLMQQHVLNPLGMADSTFDQPLDPTFEARAAEPHDENGVLVSRQSYQWLAGGGLYASPSDYAKAVLLAMDPSSQPFYLNQSEVDTILTDHCADSTRYGYGAYLSQASVSAASGGFFTHSGYLPDMSWTKMVGHPQLGCGIVIAVNSDGGAPQLVSEIEMAFRGVYGF